MLGKHMWADINAPPTTATYSTQGSEELVALPYLLPVNSRTGERGLRQGMLGGSVWNHGGYVSATGTCERFDGVLYPRATLHTGTIWSLTDGVHCAEQGQVADVKRSGCGRVRAHEDALDAFVPIQGRLPRCCGP